MRTTIRPSGTRGRGLCHLLSVLLLAAWWQGAGAALLGESRGNPDLGFEDTSPSAIQYAGGVFTVLSPATTITYGNGTTPAVNPGVLGDEVAFNVQVAPDGTFLGGASDTDLRVVGATLTSLGAPVNGVLLTGRAIAFGFADLGTTDQFEFKFRVTGGLLAGEFGGVGSEVASLISCGINNPSGCAFGGTFVDNAAYGSVKGNLGPLSIQVEKFTNGHDADGANGPATPTPPDGPFVPGAAAVPSIAAGDTVTWTYRVKNFFDALGDQLGETVTVQDSVLGLVGQDKTLNFVGGDTDNDGVFDPGEVWIYEFVGSADALSQGVPGCGDGRPTYENEATVTTTFRVGRGTVTLTNGDLSHYCNPQPEPASLGDRVWEDLDANGVQDPGEPGVNGVTVRLTDCAGGTVADLDGLTVPDTVTGFNVATMMDGYYEFSNLPAGQYCVEFLKPFGYQFTLRGPIGIKDPADSDPDRTTGLTEDITLASGEDDPTWDAGLVRPASIGDRVWNDTNRDGIQDGGEPGVPGTTVALLDCAANPVEDIFGNPVLPTFTDGSGLYSFGNLVPGQYTVKFTNSDATLEFTVPGPTGAKDPLDSDPVAYSPDGTMGTTECITVESGENDDTWDAGLRPVEGSKLGDFVWEDMNADGSQDFELDRGIPGVTVELLTCDQFDNKTGTGLTDVTDADGMYLFDSLVAGRYAVRFALNSPALAGYAQSPANAVADDVDSDAALGTGETACIDLGANATNLTLDAGFYRPASIGDRVWNDTNRDGIQDVGEPGVPGTTVALLDCAGDPVQDIFGNLVLPTLTNGSGLYSFDNLVPGQYTVKFTNSDATLEFTVPGPTGAKDPLDSDPVAYSPDGTMGTTECITVESGENDDTWDAGLRPVEGSRLGDFVWEDMNADGSQDFELDRGIPGVKVELLTCDQFDNKMATGLTDVTDADGMYLFEDISAGRYAVRFDLASVALDGYLQSPVDAVADDVDSDAALGTGETACIDLGANATNLTLDAGFYRPASIGDRVWNDTNRDGIQDVGEPGVPGTTVALVDCAGDPVQDIFGNPVVSTLTDGSGLYSFENLLPGQYRVKFTNNDAALEFTVPGPTGVKDPLDSDPVAYSPDGTMGTTECITVESGEDDDSWDAGLILPPMPGIDIRKQEEGPDARAFLPGEDVSFEIEVTNTGNVDLLNVVVTDFLSNECDNVIGTLAVGESFLYSCTVPSVLAGYENEACVAGDFETTTVDDCDPSTVELIDIDIRKQVEGPDSRTFPAGANVGFEIAVTNTGEADLLNVQVTDVQVPGCAQFIGPLAVGDTFTYNCAANNVQSSFTNVAKVTGERNGKTVMDDDPSTVEVIDIDIRKQAEGPDSRSVVSGADVSFEIVVTNTGDEDLVDVTVADPLVPDCDRAIGPLAAGASVTYSCTAANAVSGFTNVAKATGTRNGVMVMDDDPSTVTVFLLTIDIRKQAEGPDSRTFAPGSDVSFQIVVTNTSTIPLTDVEVTDAQVPGCAKVIGDLGPGDSDSYLCTAPGVATGFTNEACVEGTGSGITVTDCDPSRVEIPNIDIRKQAEGPDTRTFPPGSTVSFDIVVTNTGSIPLTDVIVDDPLVPDCDRVIGNLAVGASTPYTCTTTLGTGAGTTKVFKDTFGSQSYSRNDGTHDWLGPWVEDDVKGPGPSSGNVFISSSNWKLWLDDNPDSGTHPSAARSADLTGATSAAFSFDWQTHSGVDDSDAITVEVSSDGGANYTTLEVMTGYEFKGGKSGSRSYDISAYISAETTIRFRVSKYYGGDNETFKVDNVMITAEMPASAVGFTNVACVTGDGDGVTVEDCDPSTVEPTPEQCKLVVTKTADKDFIDCSCSLKQDDSDSDSDTDSDSGKDYNHNGDTDDSDSDSDSEDLFTCKCVRHISSHEDADSDSDSDTDSDSGMDHNQNDDTDDSDSDSDSGDYGAEVCPANQTVTYSYAVMNEGSALSHVSVLDDRLGELAGPEPTDFPTMFAAGQTETRTRTACIFETTTNTVQAKGKLSDESLCESNTASWTVTVGDPPPPTGCVGSDSDSDSDGDQGDSEGDSDYGDTDDTDDGPDCDGDSDSDQPESSCNWWQWWCK